MAWTGRRPATVRAQSVLFLIEHYRVLLPRPVLSCCVLHHPDRTSNSQSVLRTVQHVVVPVPGAGRAEGQGHGRGRGRGRGMRCCPLIPHSTQSVPRTPRARGWEWKSAGLAGKHPGRAWKSPSATNPAAAAERAEHALHGVPLAPDGIWSPPSRPARTCRYPESILRPVFGHVWTVAVQPEFPGPPNETKRNAPIRAERNISTRS